MDDENKIIQFNKLIEKKERTEVSLKNARSSFSYQTNPIIQRMLTFNSENTKGKFTIKDLFR
jgi:hypothetical protein